MMRSVHTYIHTYIHTAQTHTYIADKRQAARQRKVAHTETHTTQHTHGNRHAVQVSILSRSAIARGRFDSPQTGGERESMNPSPAGAAPTLPTHVSNMHVKPVFSLLGGLEEWACYLSAWSRGP